MSYLKGHINQPHKIYMKSVKKGGMYANIFITLKKNLHFIATSHNASDTDQTERKDISLTRPSSSIVISSHGN